jgi:hypothetical protein
MSSTFEAGIAERLAEQEARFRTDGAAPGVDVARVDERRRDAEARQRVIEQVVRAAVERARRDDVVAAPRRLTMARCSAACPLAVGDRADAAFERRDPLFEHCARRIGDARVDVPARSMLKRAAA